MKRTRLLIVLAVATLWMGGVVWRLWSVQVRDHESYLRRAMRQQQQVLELDPPRGTIYDRRGRELAVSVAVESAFAVPREVGEPDAAAAAIARLTGADTARL